MKKTVLSLALLLAAAQTFAGGPVDRHQAERLTAPGYHPGTVRHIVIFKFKRGTTQTEMTEVMNRFLSLKDKCTRNLKPYIRSIDAGFANSPEGADQGKQLGFTVTFASEGDRNYYVGQPQIDPKDTDLFDPAHADFKNFVGPKLATPVVPDGVFVFDYTVTGEK